MTRPDDAERERLLALWTLVHRGVGGERDNARRLLARRLESHGISPAAFEASVRSKPDLQVDTGPREESLPAGIRTMYVSGNVSVTWRQGPVAMLVRERSVGVLIRGGTLTLQGDGVVTITQDVPFRTLYASGSGTLSVTGFHFADAAFYHSGSGTLTLSGAATRAAFHLDGDAVVDAAAFSVRSCRVTLIGRSRAVIKTHDLSATVGRHARLTADVAGRSEIQREPGATVKALRPPQPDMMSKE